MDKFVVDGKNDEKLIQKIIKELATEEPVKERSQKPNTAFLNRLLSNTKKQNETASARSESQKVKRDPHKVAKPDRKKIKWRSTHASKTSTENTSTKKSKRKDTLHGKAD